MRRRNRLVRVIAPQVHIQLTIPEVFSDLMRPVHGHGCLADPGSAGERGDHHGPRPAGLAEHARERFEFRRPAGELAHRGGQLPGNRRRVRLPDACLRCSAAADLPRIGACRGSRLAAGCRAGSSVQFGPLLTDQIQGIGERAHRGPVWPHRPAALHVADRTSRHARSLGQLLLGQPASEPVAPEQRPEALVGGTRHRDGDSSSDSQSGQAITNIGTCAPNCSANCSGDRSGPYSWSPPRGVTILRIGGGTARTGRHDALVENRREDR